MADGDTPSWLDHLQQGDSAAAQKLWERYFSRLAQFAQRRMGGIPRRAADEEDIALSALNSFMKGARNEKFPSLEDESDLWALLVTITLRKVGALRRRHFAARRGGGTVRGESALQHTGEADEQRGIEAIAGEEPTPEFLAQFAEECRVLFEKLGDPLLCDIARWKMEGFSNGEIADRLGRNVRTVERKLALIRDCWSA